MPYLSQLLHSSVDDSWNERVGKLVDVVAPPPLREGPHAETGTPHARSRWSLPRPAREAAPTPQASLPAAPVPGEATPGVLALLVETPDERLLRVLPAQVGRV